MDINELAIGGAAKPTDMLWGPIPQVVSVTPYGNQAAHIEWSVSLAITTLPNVNAQKQIMEYVYTLAFSIDREGRTTRTYSGFIRIALTRSAADSRKIPASVDAYRTTVVPNVLVGFERTSQQFTIDESKTKLSFQVVDTQRYGNPLPAGIVDASAKQIWSNAVPKGMFAWNTTISGTYKLAPGNAADVAVKAFLAMFEQRLSQMKQMKYGAGFPGVPAGEPVNIFFVGANVSETNIYGPDAQGVEMSISMYVSSVGLASILAAGGLFVTTGGDWRTWTASVKDTAFGPTGTAKLVWTVGEDAIVDVGPGSQVVTPP